jgi:nucleoside-diphosphate-sugar epimerase
MRCLVTGGCGFIGAHLVRRLVQDGHQVMAIDNQRYPYGNWPAQAAAHLIDLRSNKRLRLLLNYRKPFDWVFHLAADMGGIGYIHGTRYQVAVNNGYIDQNILTALVDLHPTSRLVYASSACVYAQGVQNRPSDRGLVESDAWPADPEPGYGLEKLWMEELCRYAREEKKYHAKCLRFHNVYGPYGSYRGGREKAPAAVCRKIAEATPGGDVQVWGDGLAVRSFMYVDDCVEGLIRFMQHDTTETLNLGSEESLAVKDLYHAVSDIAGKEVNLVYDTSKPEGVRGRNSDNTLLRATLGWEPQTSLREGLSQLYPWVESQVKEDQRREELSAVHT